MTCLNISSPDQERLREAATGLSFNDLLQIKEVHQLSPKSAFVNLCHHNLKEFKHSAVSIEFVFYTGHFRDPLCPIQKWDLKDVSCAELRVFRGMKA